MNLPQVHIDLLREASDTGGDGHHESGYTEGSVDWHESSSESCRRSLTAQQDDEAEEAYHKLEENPIC